MRAPLVSISVTAAAALLLAAAPAGGHEQRTVGPVQVTVGWLDEPAFAGFKNAVQVIAEHRDGSPAGRANLQVQVIFGDGESGEATEPLELLPVVASPGEFRAFLIPTRPGTYTFHVTGRIEGGRFDEMFTSGESFDDVVNPSEAQFPVRDPTSGELAAKLDRVDARIQALRREVRSLGSADAAARILAVAAVVMAVAAAAVAAFRRPRGRGG